MLQAQQQRNQLGLPAHLPPMPTPMPPLPAADAAPADPTRPSAAEEQLYDNYFDVRARSCSDASSIMACCISVQQNLKPLHVVILWSSTSTTSGPAAANVLALTSGGQPAALSPATSITRHSVIGAIFGKHCINARHRR